MTAFRPVSPRSLIARLESKEGNSDINWLQNAGSRNSSITTWRKGCAPANCARHSSVWSRTEAFTSEITSPVYDWSSP